MSERTLRDIALDNLDVAKMLLSVYGADEGKLNIAGYHLEQCVELYLKDFLEMNGVEYRHTHDVSLLLAQCREAEIYPNGYAYLDDKSEMFTSWESKTRYIKDYSLQRKKVEDALSRLEEILRGQEEILGESEEEMRL